MTLMFNEWGQLRISVFTHTNTHTHTHTHMHACMRTHLFGGT